MEKKKLFMHEGLPASPTKTTAKNLTFGHCDNRILYRAGTRQKNFQTMHRLLTAPFFSTIVPVCNDFDKPGGRNKVVENCGFARISNKLAAIF
jgi:hypothetical protein